ncbi:hypothetical protein GY45DRAFT_81137 [Cubamyces sp. BRFM 1775]|nr:hypothetical protein GY45DRAFT_81137 [Cubamyces sp. BRFM 1775]
MYHQFLSGVTQVIVCALQIMRTYALCSRSRRILLSLLGLCGVECIISFWAVVMAWKSAEKAQTAQVGESIGCDLTMSRTQGQYMAAIWGCILIFDAVVFGLTFVRVLKAGRLWHGSLFVLLLRDGTIYFGYCICFSAVCANRRIRDNLPLRLLCRLIFVCHLTNILTCLRVYRGFSVTATNVIATSMMSRLMLKLRDPKLRDVAYHLPTAGNASPRGQGGRDQMSGTSGELESGTVTVYWASTHS